MPTSLRRLFSFAQTYACMVLGKTSSNIVVDQILICHKDPMTRLRAPARTRGKMRPVLIGTATVNELDNRHAALIARAIVADTMSAENAFHPRSAETYAVDRSETGRAGTVPGGRTSTWSGRCCAGGRS